MIVKVQAATSSSYINQYKPPQTKYYNAQAITKSKIKKDFKIILDAEIDKLHFMAIV